MKQIKVLSVCSLITGRHSASVRVNQTMRAIRSLNSAIDFVQVGRANACERLRSRDFHYDGVNTSIITDAPLMFPYRIRNLLAGKKYDLIVGNGHFGTFYVAAVAPQKMPLVFDMHGALTAEFLYENAPDRRWIYSSRLFEYFFDAVIESCNLHRATIITCISRNMMEYLHLKRNIPLKKLVYVPNAIDLAFFRAADDALLGGLRDQYGLKGKFVFGYVGDAQYYQGTDNLLAAARSYARNGATFLFVGSGHYWKQGNIVNIPRVPRSKIMDYYALCDVLVLPRPQHLATEVAAPTKFGEYAAMGKPILTTAVGDAARLVRSWQCGVVVDNNAPDALTNGFELIMGKTGAERDSMGKRARECAACEFEVGKVTDRFVNAVKEIIPRLCC